MREALGRIACAHSSRESTAMDKETHSIGFVIHRAGATCNSIAWRHGLRRYKKTHAKAMILDYKLAMMPPRAQQDLSARRAARTGYLTFCKQADKKAFESPGRSWRRTEGQEAGGAGTAPRIGQPSPRGGHPAQLLARQAARPRAARHCSALKASAVTLAVALPRLVLMRARARRAARWLDRRGARCEMSAGASPRDDNETHAFAYLVRTASGRCGELLCCQDHSASGRTVPAPRYRRLPHANRLRDG